MRLGFHYHIPAYMNHGIYTVAYLGVFLDSLAKHCDELICFLYLPVEYEMKSLDYKLKSKNITLINIGYHNQLYYRLFYGRKKLLQIKNILDGIDAFLVRAPTPLIFKLSNLIKKPFILYIVGTYINSNKGIKQNFIKNILIQMYCHYYEVRQKQIIKQNPCIVNSLELFNKYSEINEDVKVIKSTTLSKYDFFLRTDSCNEKIVKVLYTGRIDPQKGLFEIAEACFILNSKGYNIEFHIAGIEVRGLESTLENLSNFAQKNDMKNKLILHGMLMMGKELNTLYRKCDIFVTASQLIEGFPRTIWEAMANSLPVVATTVGSIPHYLKHEENAMLVNPSNPDHLSNSIERIIDDGSLRRKLITKGYELAQKNTLEIQSEKMINQIKRYIKI